MWPFSGEGDAGKNGLVTGRLRAGGTKETVVRLKSEVPETVLLERERELIHT